MWWSEPAGANGTYYSQPVIATINGQRLLISGGADGSVYAIKVRTGEPVWRYVYSSSPINTSPVVDGNFVYIGHGEESPDTSVQGRVICLDASQVEKKQPKLVWKEDGIVCRYASPIIDAGRMYVPDEGCRLFCLDAKTGKKLWRYNFGQSEAARAARCWPTGRFTWGRWPPVPHSRTGGQEVQNPGHRILPRRGRR